MKGLGLIWSMMEKYFPLQVSLGISDVRRKKDESGAVFDLNPENASLLDQSLDKAMEDGFDLKVYRAKQLPELRGKLASLPEECVWDYPRPAICEPFDGRLKIVHNGEVIAETTKGYRTLETSHPPTYYFPPDDVNIEKLWKNNRKTMCEWKGQASYYDF